jgi:hypothetical protein
MPATQAAALRWAELGARTDYDVDLGSDYSTHAYDRDTVSHAGQRAPRGDDVVNRWCIWEEVSKVDIRSVIGVIDGVCTVQNH